MQRYDSPFPSAAKARSGPESPHYPGFNIALRHTTSGRTSVGVISPMLRYLPDNTQHLQDNHVPFEFVSAIPASERQQTHALDHAATGVGMSIILSLKHII